ncbi:3'-5' exonuclease [Streptomyces alboflavus]|uniref:3'-5' exonuclease n=1 Tax=Streptomyces alboflavus TaxID=67267 RepID=UPI000F6563E3|nr:3'-5' exonuclease [Streptomyces alboflavus]
MTETRAEEAAPTNSADGLPRYRAGTAPAHLLSETALKRRRLKLAQGQQPQAYSSSRYVPRVALYDVAQAVPMRPLTPRQRAAWEARRTCGECHTMQDQPLSPAGVTWPGKPSHLLCHDCRVTLHQRWARTCGDCGTQFANTWLCGQPCTACRARHERGRQVVIRLLGRHCPDCTTQTATRAEVAAAEARHGYPVGFPRRCEPCEQALQQAAAEAQRAAERARWDELGPVREWARDVVAHPHRYAILDTETTGLDADAKIVELAVTDGAGNPLLCTLVNPQTTVPVEASAIHGITDADVAQAPTFGAVLPHLTAALHQRRVIIYNRDYDTAVLTYEADRYYRQTAPPLPGIEGPPSECHPAALEWMSAQHWDQCAMHAAAVHKGQWSDYWQGWAWPKLNGGHRALADCQAVADLIRDMAARPDPF